MLRKKSLKKSKRRRSRSKGIFSEGTKDSQTLVGTPSFITCFSFFLGTLPVTALPLLIASSTCHDGFNKTTSLWRITFAKMLQFRVEVNKFQTSFQIAKSRSRI